jgi:hypothetical protein
MLDLSGLMTVLKQIVIKIVQLIVYVIKATVNERMFERSFNEETFNIYLFSENGWFTEPVYVQDVLVWVLTVFVTFFVVKIIYRFFAKLIKKLFGVIRL